MATITFQFCEFKKIHIPCNGDIRGVYFHALCLFLTLSLTLVCVCVCVMSSDKRSPVVEQKLLKHIYTDGAAE